MADPAALRVEIWSDVVCPWCAVGKRRFEAALRDFEHADQVEVVWRAFELDPHAQSAAPGSAHEPGDYASRLAAKYGTDRPRAQQMIDTMTEAAAAEGLDFRFERAVRANTFDAHQVIQAAAAQGLQDAVKERLLLAYFTEGEAVGDRDVLVRLAAEAGLDAARVRTALAEQSAAAAVRQEEAEATMLGIRGVPFFVVDRTYGVSGAQPAAAHLEVLRKVWADRHPVTMVGAVPGQVGDACGPDGCSS